MAARDDQDAPDDRARVVWSVPAPSSDGGGGGGGGGAPEAPSAAALGEEFLFHLYRGSELLQDDQVYEAKNELERAMSFQPRDVEGQSLLGVTYFRLGHYPRAIQIYEELVRARPTEVAPRINLGLCYLKTGQLPFARRLFEELVQRWPDHIRGWGYLGLTYQRLGDVDKAVVAFDRAGRPQLAARLRGSPRPATLSESIDEPAPDAAGVQEISQDHVRAAPSVPPPPALLASGELPPTPSRRSVSGAGYAPGTRVSIPAPLEHVAREALLAFPATPRVVLHESGNVLVRIERAFHLRSDCLRARLPDSAGALSNSVLRRRAKFGAGASEGANTDEPLGGAALPFVTIEGQGRLVMGPPERFTAWASTLDREPFYAREERLLGFDASLQHSSGILRLSEGETSALVQLTGAGFLVLGVRGSVQGLDVSPSRPIEVRARHVLGWVGRLIPRPVPREEAPPGLLDLLALSGTGVVLLDGG